MIVVKYEVMQPEDDRGRQRSQIVGLIAITNDGQGTARRSDYNVGVSIHTWEADLANQLGAANNKQRRVALDLATRPEARVEGYARQAYSVWALVARSIEALRGQLPGHMSFYPAPPTPEQQTTVRVEMWPAGFSTRAQEIGRLVLRPSPDACEVEIMRRGTTDRVQKKARFQVPSEPPMGGWLYVLGAVQAAGIAGAPKRAPEVQAGSSTDFSSKSQV